MEPVTHFLTGAVLARSGFNRKAAYATMAMVLAAEMPDIDVLWSAGGPVAAFQHHRGITHTFLGLPFEGLAVMGVVWLIHRWRVQRAAKREAETPALATSGTDQPLVRPLTLAPLRWGLLYGFVLIALLSHLLLDWTNNYGVRPFFPFDKHWYAGSIVFIFDPVLFGLLLVALIGPALFGLISSEVGAHKPAFRGRSWAIFALVGMASLWGWRQVEHNAAVELASNALYGPRSTGAEVLRVTASPYPVNPYRWHTVVDTPKFYQTASVNTYDAKVDTDPGHDLFYKPQDEPAIRAAMQSYLGQVYLDWSSWPLVSDIGPAIPPDAAPNAPAYTAVSFRDLRFMYDTALVQGRNQPPLSGMVYLDPSLHIARMQFGDREQR